MELQRRYGVIWGYMELKAKEIHGKMSSNRGYWCLGF